MKEAIDKIPLDKFICKTDSPYLPMGNWNYSYPFEGLNVMKELAKRKYLQLNDIMTRMQINTACLYTEFGNKDI